MEKTKARSMKIHVHYDCKTLHFHLNANDSQTYFPAHIPLYNQMAGVHFHQGSNSLQYFKVNVFKTDHTAHPNMHLLLFSLSYCDITPLGLLIQARKLKIILEISSPLSPNNQSPSPTTFIL